MRGISYEHFATFILKYYESLNLPLNRRPGLSKNVNIPALGIHQWVNTLSVTAVSNLCYQIRYTVVVTNVCFACRQSLRQCIYYDLCVLNTHTSITMPDSLKLTYAASYGRRYKKTNHGSKQAYLPNCEDIKHRETTTTRRTDL